jgi:ATP-dependent DNA ligase
MAATLTQERFAGPEWIFERKFDGIRLLAFKHGSDVRLFSRNRLPEHSSVARAIASMPAENLILDGEITWDRSGAYHVFDIIWLDDRDVTAFPVEERRELLRRLTFPEPLERVEALDDPDPWERARKKVGRRHCQAAWLTLRASSIAAMAQDEV